MALTKLNPPGPNAMGLGHGWRQGMPHARYIAADGVTKRMRASLPTILTLESPTVHNQSVFIMHWSCQIADKEFPCRG